MSRRPVPVVALLLVVLASGCARGASSPPGAIPSGAAAPSTTSPLPTTTPSPTTAPRSTASPRSTTSPSPQPSATAAPAWLGTRVLEPGPTGFPPPQPTPDGLFPRSIATEDVLPPPPDDGFHAAVDPVGQDTADRSTWHPGCPVGLADLRLLTVSHWGFDGEHHTGEVLVHADAVDAVVAIFAAMHRERFPLEQVAIITPEDLEAPATGDGNITSAFVCRRTRGSSAWSAHASGRALDVNPFHNPYDRQDDDGRVVLPELATAYTDRTIDLPGMLTADSPVVAAIEAAGWHWGGHYTSLNDPMHVSATGR